jgi:hypothetical protein
MILAGDSGTGKTGALASLANAGYELFILDFDNGLDPLYKYVMPEAKGRVHFHTLQDKINLSGTTVSVGMADSYARAMQQLNNWTDDKKSFGAVASWGPERILVLDSLTFMSNAVLRAVLVREGMNNFKPIAQKGKPDPRNIIGEAQNVIEGLLALLYDPRIKCNVILISHIRSVGDGDAERYHPSALGKALPPIVSRYFNWMVEFKQEKGNRVISTIPGRLATKAPADLPPVLQITDGLARIFQQVLGNPPKLADSPRAATTTTTGANAT